MYLIRGKYKKRNSFILCPLSVVATGMLLLGRSSDDDEEGKWFEMRPLPPSSGPHECLPGKRENRENLLRERRLGGGDATDGERGGVTAEREEEEEEGQRERDEFGLTSLLQLHLSF